MTAHQASIRFWDDGCAVFLDRESQTVILDADHASALRQYLQMANPGAPSSESGSSSQLFDVETVLDALKTLSDTSSAE